MTPYNLEILERWIREFPQIRTLTELTGLSTAMKLQGQNESWGNNRYGNTRGKRNRTVQILQRNNDLKGDKMTAIPNP